MSLRRPAATAALLVLSLLLVLGGSTAYAARNTRLVTVTRENMRG